jgi:hypothetical protein
MRFFADILVFLGAILLTFGTDLELQTSGQSLNSVGGLLGVIASLIGTAFLTTGILNHYRLSRDTAAPQIDEPAASKDKGKVDHRG